MMFVFNQPLKSLLSRRDVCRLPLFVTCVTFEVNATTSTYDYLTNIHTRLGIKERKEETIKTHSKERPPVGRDLPLKTFEREHPAPAIHNLDVAKDAFKANDTSRMLNERKMVVMG